MDIMLRNLAIASIVTIITILVLENILWWAVGGADLLVKLFGS